MNGRNGRFVWFDLVTPDPQAAMDFYGEVIGWKATPWSGGNYEILNAGDTQVGGVLELSAEGRKSGTPPHWLGYVATPDAATTVQRAEKMRGRVVVPLKELPNVGRYAVLADPQRAVFGAYQTTSNEGLPDVKALGQFCWSELNTTDWKSAWQFYSELFGWTHTRSTELGGELGEYFMFGNDAKDSLGGFSNAATTMKARPHWLHYVNVKDADACAKLITQRGGTILNGPMDVPEGGRIAQCADPQRGRFGIFSAKA